MRMNKVYFPIVLAVAVAGGLLLGSKLNPSTENTFLGKNANRNKLNKLIDFIEKEYVDSLNTDSIVDLTVNGILEKLDPHSVYIPKKELAAVEQSMRGDFVGIGVNFYMYNDSVAIIKPVPNGPSEKAGLKAGDRILFADKLQLYNKKLETDTLFSILKGEQGSNVKLTVYRKSEKKKFAVNVTRDVIPIKSVDVAQMLDKTTGYIKINRFAEKTYEEFLAGLTKLKSEGANHIIVDLRDNGGGYLDSAEKIADEFLKNKELIVKTKNKKGNIDSTLATEKGIFETGKVSILINENSASASEVLAGAIQDNDRGLIFGRRSFGKGLVQREMPLGDGSAVRLTVARYYTPSGRSIQKPYEDKGENYFNEFDKRFESGELYEKDKVKIADSLKFKTKKGRIVYGGGGIMPDVFVPYEDAHGSEGLTMLMQSGLVNYFVFEQLDKNRKKFDGISNDDLEIEIKKGNYFNDFKIYMAKGGLLFNLDTQKEKVLFYLQAEFVRQLFNEKAYYQLILKKDNMVNKVLSK
ncbi:S41 family peptidase [Flavobacterium channae]|uniref:S41 family peptidase n=1 Tax=Flavobacterium channae TaxID=2897181 RepID=UPI001E4A2451|nr:S41 family peptidase [Flavobacterium channae]UGS23891.1 S41 family peptidase [Flavobacterium channae]